MTARVVLLPTENADEFKGRMTGLCDELRPRTNLQRFHAERAAYSSWQLDRATRAQSARLLFRAKTNAQDARDRVAQEVAGLGQKLLRAPFGRPAAHPFAEGGDDQTTEVGAGLIDQADHPAQLVMRLESTRVGCQWLLARWNELGAFLEGGMAWLAPERFRVFRLLGIHPSDALFTTELTSLLQACEVIDPSAGSLVSEIWNEMVSAEALPSLHESYQRRIRHVSAPDEETAQAYLLGVVARATARLEERSEERAARENLEAALAPHLLAFDDSPTGALLRRYEQTCENSMRHHTDEVRRIHAASAEPGGLLYYGPYQQPSPGWFAGLGEAIDGDDANDCTDSCDCAEQGDGTCAREDSAIGGGEDVAIEAGVLRNEANPAEVPVGNDVGVLPNEPRDSEPAVASHVPSHESGPNGAGQSETPDAIRGLAIGLGIRRDGRHANALTGSRRERRRRKKEQRSARGRSR